MPISNVQFRHQISNPTFYQGDRKKYQMNITQGLNMPILLLFIYLILHFNTIGPIGYTYAEYDDCNFWVKLNKIRPLTYFYIPKSHKINNKFQRMVNGNTENIKHINVVHCNKGHSLFENSIDKLAIS